METEDFYQTRTRTRRSSCQIVESSSQPPSSDMMMMMMNQEQKSQRTVNRMILRVVTSLLLAANLASLSCVEGAMSLPDGIENILGFVPRSTFQCERDGYFGDIDNDCRIFHLCQKQVHANGRTEWRHWTYACGNQTMFNQLTLTCAFVDEAIPCKHASQFQYLNEVIHKPREPFLTDADVTSGISYYSNRVMSDGARARAFEDSRLMAQLGGGSNLVHKQVAAQTHHNANLAQHSPAASDHNAHLQPESSLLNLNNAIDQPIQSERNTFLQDFAPNQRQQLAVLAPAQPAEQLNQLPQVHFLPVTVATPTPQVATHSPQQQQQTGPNSFEFSITTNHQQAASAPVATLISNANPLPRLRTTTTTTTAPVARPRQQETTTLRFASVTTTTMSTPTSRVPLSTTTSQRPDAITTTTQRSAQHQARRRKASRQTSQQQTRPQRQHALDHQLNGMFQSTRLGSPVAAQTQSNRSTTIQPRPALVMRRHVQPSSDLGAGSATFWRHPFEALTMANRFESMLTRRRV